MQTSTPSGVVAKLPRWARAAATGVCLVVAAVVMLSVGLPHWGSVDTAFLVGMWLAFAGVVWWDHRKGQFDLLRSSFTFAAVLIYVRLLTLIYERNEVAAWIVMGVLLLAVVGWRARRGPKQEIHIAEPDESRQVSDVDQRGP